MWHMTNLRNYMGLSTIQEKKTCWESDESVSIPRGIILTDKAFITQTPVNITLKPLITVK